MHKNQKSVRNGIEDFLCPFTDMYITQGSNSNFTHRGIMANDVRGSINGVKYPYYAPCTCKCIKTYKSSGQVMWQSINKVRFANGRIDYATFMTAHDDNMNVVVNKIVEQGDKLGNMGSKGNVTGVHCHIQVSQSNDTTWTKNKYGNYKFNNEYDLDDCYFIDNTNILNGMGGTWKKTTDVKVELSNNKKYVNLPKSVLSWRIYDINSFPIKKNTKGYLKPHKFGGLSYLIYGYRDYNTTVVINTLNFGRVKIYISDTNATITDKPIYEHGEY